MFVDTHAHLTDIAFKDDLEAIIKKCDDIGVSKIITSGFDISSSKEAIVLANKYQSVYASVGVYPCEVDKLETDYLKKIKDFFANKKVVAVGEIGLEFREGCPAKERQLECFYEQIKLAKDLRKPIVIHCRDAIGTMIEFLNDNKNLLDFSGTFHCFGQSKEVARQILDLGFYISLGGVSTFKNAKVVKEAISYIPLNKIMLETDCPYLTPEPFRGERNDSSFIPLIAENLAKVKGVSVEEIALQTSENARRLFGI